MFNRVARVKFTLPTGTFGLRGSSEFTKTPSREQQMRMRKQKRKNRTRPRKYHPSYYRIMNIANLENECLEQGLNLDDLPEPWATKMLNVKHGYPMNRPRKISACAGGGVLEINQNPAIMKLNMKKRAYLKPQGLVRAKRRRNRRGANALNRLLQQATPKDQRPQSRVPEIDENQFVSRGMMAAKLLKENEQTLKTPQKRGRGGIPGHSSLLQAQGTPTLKGPVQAQGTPILKEPVQLELKEPVQLEQVAIKPQGTPGLKVYSTPDSKPAIKAATTTSPTEDPTEDVEVYELSRVPTPLLPEPKSRITLSSPNTDMATNCIPRYSIPGDVHKEYLHFSPEAIREPFVLQVETCFAEHISPAPLEPVGIVTQGGRKSGIKDGIREGRQLFISPGKQLPPFSRDQVTKVVLSARKRPKSATKRGAKDSGYTPRMKRRRMSFCPNSKSSAQKSGRKGSQSSRLFGAIQDSSGPPAVYALGEKMIQHNPKPDPDEAQCGHKEAYVKGSLIWIKCVSGEKEVELPGVVVNFNWSEGSYVIKYLTPGDENLETAPSTTVPCENVLRVAYQTDLGSIVEKMDHSTKIMLRLERPDIRQLII